MSIVNKPNCNNGPGNTGTPSCSFALTHPSFAFITPPQFYIPTATLATWTETETFLKTAMKAENPLNRIYPLGIIDFTDNSPDAEEKTTSNYGVTTGFVEKPSKWQITHPNAGIEFFKNLRKFNNLSGWRVMIADASGWLGGINTELGFAGIKMMAFSKQKWGNVNTETMLTTDFMFYESNIAGKLDGIAVNDTYDWADNFKGLLDVSLTATGGQSSFTLSIIEKASGINLVDLYGSEIAVANLIKCTNSSGTAVVLGGVSVLGSNLFVNVSEVGTHSIKLADPATLESAGIGGGFSPAYDSDEIVVIVSPTPVASIRMSKSTTSIIVGANETLTVEFTPSNATDKTLTWSSSDPAKATVDNAGKVTAVSAGSSIITATSTDGAKKATCSVTVTAS